MGKVVTKYPPLTYYSYLRGAAWGPRMEGAAVKGVTKYRLTASDLVAHLPCTNYHFT